MEKFKIFAILFIVATIFYFTQSVPLCKVSSDVENLSTQQPNTPPKKAVYTTDEVLQLQSYNITMFNVQGISMTPTIKDGSQCLCIKKESYKIGDIIAFTLNYDGETWAIMHRIKSIDNGFITTKGDYNNFTDPKITNDAVICSIPHVPRYMVSIGR